MLKTNISSLISPKARSAWIQLLGVDNGLQEKFIAFFLLGWPDYHCAPMGTLDPFKIGMFQRCWENPNLHIFTIGRIVSTEWGCHRNINEGQEEERGLADWPFLSPRCKALNVERLIMGVSLKRRTGRALKFRSYSQLCWGRMKVINILHQIGRHLSSLLICWGMGMCGVFCCC